MILGVKQSNAFGSDFSGAAAALGRALAGPTASVQLRVQQLQAMDEYRNSQLEIAKQRLEIERQNSEAARASHEATTNFNQSKNQELQTQLQQRETAGKSLGEYLAGAVQHPPMVYANSPELYDNWQRQQKALHDAGPMIVSQSNGAGDAATGFQKAYATPMIVGGTPDQMRRGSTLQGHLPTQSNVLGAGDTLGTDQSIREKQNTPHFSEGGDVVAIPDQTSPSGYRQERVGGVDPYSFTGGSIEAQNANRMIEDYRRQRIAQGVPPQQVEQELPVFAASIAKSRMYPSTYHEGVNDQGDRVLRAAPNPNMPGVPAPVPVAPRSSPLVDMMSREPRP